MNVLYCALDANEFNRISVCTSTKEIQDTLEVTHEGTNQVKESKINLLVHKYELFKIEPNESISNMFIRFTDITNSLKSLGKNYTNSELVQKILRSLPKSWESKVTAIQEAKDLNNLPLDELLGPLMTYELSKNQSTEEEDSRKKRTLALNVADESKDDVESLDSQKEGELALITREFKKILRRRGNFRKRKALNKGDPSKKKEKRKIIK